jgi:hypothetical protein
MKERNHLEYLGTFHLIYSHSIDHTVVEFVIRG